MKSFFFFTASDLLLPDSTIFLAVKLSVCQQGFSCRYSPCETPTFFCARKGFMGKMFFTFYSKTCSDTGIICVYDLLFFSLSVLLPENLFLREMVIRYIKIW